MKLMKHEQFKLWTYESRAVCMRCFWSVCIYCLRYAYLEVEANKILPK